VTRTTHFSFGVITKRCNIEVTPSSKSASDDGQCPRLLQRPIYFLSWLWWERKWESCSTQRW